MVMSTTEPRETRRSPSACPARPAPSSTRRQTTLYDLLAALHADVGPNDDAVVTAAVVHLLQTHRVIYTSGGTRYRLVWDGAAGPTLSCLPAAAPHGASAAQTST